MRVAVLILATIMILGCGYGSNYNAGMPPPGATPSITELVPNATPAGSPAFTLTVNGDSFASGSIVYWNNAPLATSYVTAKQVTAAVPAADVAMSGTFPVYVRSGTNNSNTVNFTVQ